MISNITDPLRFFKTTSESLAQQAEAHFEKLVQQSGIDVNKNRDTVTQYAQLTQEANKMAIRSGLLLAACIVLFILAASCAIPAILLLVSDGTEYIEQVLLLSAVAIICIPLFIIAVTHRKNISAKSKQQREDADILLKKAWAQMEPLNALFTNHDIHHLVEATMDGLEFLPHCTAEHIARMAQQQGFQEPKWSSSSVRNVQAGFLNGNPFLLTHLQTHSMGLKTYYGQLEYHWVEVVEVTETYYETERYRDEQGNWQERQVEKTRIVKKKINRSDVLDADVTKPIPCYANHSTLGYVHPAAPDLTFSRSALHAERATEAQRGWLIQFFGKKLRRYSEKSLQNGGNFQLMHNQSFEALFAAANRNHEVQFRTLFTPIAQRNMEQLLTSTDGYGDDFHFVKNHCYNEIRCEHMAKGISSTDARHLRSYSLDLARKQFTNLTRTFFKEFFFCFAPLLAIPAYLESNRLAEVPSDAVASHFSRHEHEAIANALPWKSIAPEGVTTKCMLHAKRLATTETADIVQITSQGYQPVQRCAYISKWGKDKEYHDVPVEWTEYIPIEKTFRISVAHATEENCHCGVCMHGLVARILTNDNKED